MIDKYPSRPGLQYKVQDMLELQGNFSNLGAVLDKGALDALMGDASQATLDKATHLFSSFSHVLSQDGVYICISLCQDHILALLLSFYQDTRVEVSSFEIPGHMCPFLLVVHVHEAGLWTLDGEPMSDVVHAFEQRRRRYGILKDLKEPSIGKIRGRYGVDKDRFVIVVVDSGLTQCNISCGVLVVPQGRELDFAFSDESSLVDLAMSNSIQRLLVVNLGRKHSFSSMQSIHAELSPLVLDFVEDKDLAIPFLAVEGENIGDRQVLHQETSEVSGSFVVEDVDQERRRLVFLANHLGTIQSEARLIQGEVDHSDLSTCEYYGFMVEAIQALLPSSCLVLGLGGGLLASHLSSLVDSVIGVELDPCIIHVARTYFDLRPQVQVVEGDAKKVMMDHQHDCEVVVMDLDEKDASKGVVCPPGAFLEEDVLKAVSKHLFINFGAKQGAKNMLQRIQAVFNNVQIRRSEEGNLNSVVYASNQQGVVLDKFKVVLEGGLVSKQVNKKKKKKKRRR